jgi:hypothetical protein
MDIRADIRHTIEKPLNIQVDASDIGLMSWRYLHSGLTVHSCHEVQSLSTSAYCTLISLLVCTLACVRRFQVFTDQCKARKELLKWTQDQPEVASAAFDLARQQRLSISDAILNNIHRRCVTKNNEQHL